MLAFHGDSTIKQTYLARVAAHQLAGQIVKGMYWDGTKGCAVGVTVHCGRHLDYQRNLGIPRVLAHIEERVFEALPLEAAKSFPLRFLKAIPVGSDLSGVTWQFMHWVLTQCFSFEEEARHVVDRVIPLVAMLAQGKKPERREMANAQRQCRRYSFSHGTMTGYLLMFMLQGRAFILDSGGNPVVKAAKLLEMIAAAPVISQSGNLDRMRQLAA